MVRFLGTLFFLLGLTFAAVAKTPVVVSKMPAWVTPVAFNADCHYKKADISDGFLTILTDQQINVGRQEYFFHSTRKIFSKVGVQNGSEIAVNYDPDYEKLQFHSVTIIRNGLQINKLDAGRFKLIQRESSREMFIYDGSYTAILTLDDVREGDIIDYTFTISGDNPIFKGRFTYAFYLQQHDPLDKLSVKIMVPESRHLEIKHFGRETKPQISRLGSDKIYLWQLEKVKGLTMDDNVPEWYDPYPWVSLSEYRSWEEVNKWALELFEYPKVNSDALTKKIEAIRRENRSDANRITAALKFVQNDIRYLGIESGISSHKPFAPAKVFDQRYGDCKDKANLLSFMLNEMDIKSYPVLVNTQSRHEIKTWLPGPGGFNHCVTLVQLPGKTIWLDPTISNQTGPYDQLYFPEYGYGLVIKPGTTGLTKIVPPANTGLKIDEAFTVTKGSKVVDYRVETAYSGGEADMQREYFESSSTADIEKNYLNFYGEIYPGVQQTKEVMTVENEEENTFVVFENYAIEDFWTRTEKNQSELSCLIYPQVLSNKITLPATRFRTMPFDLEYPLNYEQVTQVYLAEPWTITPEDLTIDENGLFFRKEVSLDHDLVTIKYTYKTLKAYVEAKDVPAFIKTQKKIRDSLGYSLSQLQPEPVVAGTRQPVPVFYWLIGLALILVCFGGYKLYYYDPLPQPQFAAAPRKVDGWLVLVALGLGITPLRVLMQTISADYLNPTYWNNFGDPASTFYRPGYQFLLGLEFTYNLVLIGMSAVLLFLFLKRRSNVPIAMIGYYLINASFIIFEGFYLYRVGLQDSINFTDVLKVAVPLFVWAPYFYYSQRVKYTFVTTLQPIPVPEPEREEAEPEYSDSESFAITEDQLA